MTCFQDSIGLAHSLDLTQHDFFSVQLASLLVISNFDAIATLNEISAFLLIMIMIV